MHFRSVIFATPVASFGARRLPIKLALLILCTELTQQPAAVQPSDQQQHARKVVRSEKLPVGTPQNNERAILRRQTQKLLSHSLVAVNATSNASSNASIQESDLRDDEAEFLSDGNSLQSDLLEDSVVNEEDDQERSLLGGRLSSREACPPPQHPLFRCSKCPADPNAGPNAPTAQGPWCKIPHWDKAAIEHFGLQGGDTFMCDLKAGPTPDQPFARPFMYFHKDSTQCATDAKWGVPQDSVCAINCKGFTWGKFQYFAPTIDAVRCLGVIDKETNRTKMNWETKLDVTVCDFAPMVYLYVFAGIIGIGGLCTACAGLKSWKKSRSRGDDWDD